MNTESSMNDEVVKEKIRRALLSGPPSVTRQATVAEMDAQGNMVVLRQATNQWVCMPGNENIIGNVPMCLDPMGMQWFEDIRAKKPKPTNATPGLIYMLCGATQRSFTDPFDTTSPAIPIGPHWMGPLAFRGGSFRPANGYARRRNNDYVCGNTLCPFAHMRFTVGWE